MSSEEDPSPFPDVLWGRSDTQAARAGGWLVGSRAGSWLVRTMVPVDRWLLQRSDGRYTALGPFGTPLLLLTTVGARSSLPRTTPLVFLRDGDRILVAGSNFGQSAHPGWSTNLLAHPDATVDIGGRRLPVRARPLEGSERERGWAMFRQSARPYRVYDIRTTRTIRVFSLERTEEERT